MGGEKFTGVCGKGSDRERIVGGAGIAEERDDVDFVSFGDDANDGSLGDVILRLPLPYLLSELAIKSANSASVGEDDDVGWSVLLELGSQESGIGGWEAFFGQETVDFVVEIGLPDEVTHEGMVHADIGTTISRDGQGGVSKLLVKKDSIIWFEDLTPYDSTVSWVERTDDIGFSCDKDGGLCFVVDIGVGLDDTVEARGEVRSGRGVGSFRNTQTRYVPVNLASLSLGEGGYIMGTEQDRE